MAGLVFCTEMSVFLTNAHLHSDSCVSVELMRGELDTVRSEAPEIKSGALIWALTNGNSVPGERKCSHIPQRKCSCFCVGVFFFFFGHRYFNLITWVNYPCSSYLNPLPHSIILFFSSPIFCQSTDIILQSLLSVSFSRIKSPGGQRLCLVHCFIPSTCQMVGIINI